MTYPIFEFYLLNSIDSTKKNMNRSVEVIYERYAIMISSIGWFLINVARFRIHLPPPYSYFQMRHF